MMIKEHFCFECFLNKVHPREYNFLLLKKPFSKGLWMFERFRFDLIGSCCFCSLAGGCRVFSDLKRLTRTLWPVRKVRKVINNRLVHFQSTRSGWVRISFFFFITTNTIRGGLAPDLLPPGHLLRWPKSDKSFGQIHHSHTALIIRIGWCV